MSCVLLFVSAGQVHLMLGAQPCSMFHCTSSDKAGSIDNKQVKKEEN